ncbi:periplasmic binding protein [Gloeocapsa sp. PCC 7428]|uniref:ABC transporter substrate-binding protein n=1 Tax=Gloeocapsa sp. PCC 7428 TaxID=1173026 RepID=UPI0002A601FD|nr:iron-siderophore ABC transporter substrate-binding protein [Gloeocapsa sp. PCC 7428]AFZ28908.1 periplasmic binding protein [Gloeocapsa sp. PCC 7428]
MQLQKFGVCLIPILIAACHLNQAPTTSYNTASTTQCRSINHEFGNTQICRQPQRIIAYDPGSLDLLLALGVEPVGYTGFSQVVPNSLKAGEAINEFGYLSDRITTSPTYIGNYSSPSLETILKLKPDLILITYSYGDRTQYDQFSKLAPTLALSGGDFPWQQRLLTLAQVLNREPQAQQVLARYQQKVAAAKAKLEPISRNNKVLLLYFARPDHLPISTDKIFAGALLQDLGFQLVIPQRTIDVDGVIRGVSLEVLPQLEADIIIVMAGGSEGIRKVKQLWNQNPLLQAVSNDVKLYFVDGYLWAFLDGPIAAEQIIDNVQELLLPTVDISMYLHQFNASR